jgi:hypothetical protein
MRTGRLLSSSHTLEARDGVDRELNFLNSTTYSVPIVHLVPTTFWTMTALYPPEENKCMGWLKYDGS